MDLDLGANGPRARLIRARFLAVCGHCGSLELANKFFVYMLVKANISNWGIATFVDSPHGPQIHRRILAAWPRQAKRGHCGPCKNKWSTMPTFIVYTVVDMHTVVCCWGVLVSVGSPHDPQTSVNAYMLTCLCNHMLTCLCAYMLMCLYNHVLI